MGATNLTTKQIESIQIDEGIIFLNYEEAGERQLAPTRGGGEFTVTNNVRQIEHDGAQGAEEGLEVVDGQDATLKVTVLDNGQENLAMAIPGAVQAEDGSITSGKNGVLPTDSYLKNVTMFAKLIGGNWKKITLYRAKHLGALGVKATPKAEGEIALEFKGHFNSKNADAPLWKIEEVDTEPETAAPEDDVEE